MFLSLNLSGLIHTAVICHEQKSKNWEQDSELVSNTEGDTVITVLAAVPFKWRTVLQKLYMIREE